MNNVSPHVVSSLSTIYHDPGFSALMRLQISDLHSTPSALIIDWNSYKILLLLKWKVVKLSPEECKYYLLNLIGKRSRATGLLAKLIGGWP